MTCVTLTLSASTKISLGLYSKFILLFSSPLFFSFLNSLLFIIISSITFVITSFRLNFSLFSFKDWLSIFVTSSMSSVSRCNLFAFLVIVSNNWRCSVSFILAWRTSDKPSIGWIGVRNSWLATLINSFCIFSWTFNCSLAASSFS
jgi:hypothetical protein